MSASISDAQLIAFLSGEIEDEATLCAIEDAINADPALAERAERLTTNDAATDAVRAAFDPVLTKPVPERLTRIVQPPERAPLPVPANDTGRSWRWPQFAAIAASLVLGVMIGGPLLTGNGGDAGLQGGSLVLASSELEGMLDTAPSGQGVELAGLGTGEVVLTFRNGDGSLCRQFTIAGSDGISDAVACAQSGGEGWQIDAFGRRSPAPSGEMKLAAGDAAPAVVAAVDAMIDSDPMIGKDEASALKAR